MMRARSTPLWQVSRALLLSGTRLSGNRGGVLVPTSVAGPRPFTTSSRLASTDDTKPKPAPSGEGATTTVVKKEEVPPPAKQDKQQADPVPAQELTAAAYWSNDVTHQAEKQRAKQLAKRYKRKVLRADAPEEPSTEPREPARPLAPTVAEYDSGFRFRPFMHPTVFTEPQSHTFPVHNPATGEVMAYVPDGSVAHTQFVVELAAREFKSWRKRTARERSALLRKWADLMLANADYLAGVMTAEQGKPFAEAKGEVAYGRTRVGGARNEEGGVLLLLLLLLLLLVLLLLSVRVIRAAFVLRLCLRRRLLVMDIAVAVTAVVIVALWAQQQLQQLLRTVPLLQPRERKRQQVRSV